jgi:hypothetical protein
VNVTLSPLRSSLNPVSLSELSFQVSETELLQSCEQSATRLLGATGVAIAVGVGVEVGVGLAVAVAVAIGVGQPRVVVLATFEYAENRSLLLRTQCR